PLVEGHPRTEPDHDRVNPGPPGRPIVDVDRLDGRGRPDRERDGGRGAGESAVVGRVRESVGPAEAAGRLVGEGAVGVKREGSVGGSAKEHGSQRAVVGGGGAGQYSGGGDRERPVAAGAVGAAGGRRAGNIGQICPRPPVHGGNSCRTEAVWTG